MPVLLYFSLVSASTQKMLTNLLQDEAWTDSFLKQSEQSLGTVCVCVCVCFPCGVSSSLFPLLRGLFPTTHCSFLLSSPIA